MSSRARPLRIAVAALAPLVVAFAIASCAALAPARAPTLGTAPAPAPSPAPAPACPDGMALVRPAQEPAFCIDRWEASLVDADSGDPFPFNRSPKGKRVRAVTRAGVVPQGYISYLEAKAACEASRKRLCAEREWVRACKGSQGTTYPYGNERKPGVCNDDGTNAMLRMPPSQRAMTMINMNDPTLLTLPSTVARTGERDGCKSEDGVFDMMGNLHEWVADGVPPEQSIRNGFTAEAFAGGFFLDTHINGDGCDYKTTAHADWYHDYSTGFRCCANLH